MSAARRVVVKVGTSAITHAAGGLHFGHLERLVRQLVDIVADGRQLVLVSSGAIGAGMGRLGLRQRPRTLPEKQAVAAVGQGVLMQAYEKLFGEYGHIVAQVLLTREDMMARSRYLNSRQTLLTLLHMRVIPIVNENDTVAVDEIRFGDNDTLSALVASLVDADLLIILSDVDGLYARDPRRDPEAPLVPLVRHIDPVLEAAAGGPGTTRGSGGMRTKLQAARVAARAGIPLVIANSARPQVLQEILAGAPVGTLFLPDGKRLAGRKRWLAFYQRPKGELVVDEGAIRALREEGKSLLPAGVQALSGQFQRGDLVRVVDPQGQEVARGLVNYSALELARIRGLSSREVAASLGPGADEEVIHRDNLVLTD